MFELQEPPPPASHTQAVISISLPTTPAQTAKLKALQQGFAQLCNALAPIVQSTRVWNRVALHHLTYRQLRAQFPHMGAQMVCNAIYSVSRTCRLVFQNPNSALHMDQMQDKVLPLLHFADDCPVYFDRHTLSLKAGRLSIFTLEGRMRLALDASLELEECLRTHKLREVVLACRAGEGYVLTFITSIPQAQTSASTLSCGSTPVDVPAIATVPITAANPDELPDYVIANDVL